jgi:hypothetical protein
VFNELVAVTQATSVPHLIAIHQDRVVHTIAQPQAVGAGYLSVASEAKGTGPDYVAATIAQAHIEFDVLASRVHGRVVEDDVEAALVAAPWPDRPELRR